MKPANYNQIIFILSILFSVNTIFAQTQNNPDFYLYPTPSELFDVIDKENVPFRKDLLNSTDNEANYVLSRAQYLNIGVYLSDLAYCGFFSRKTQSLEYIKTITELSTTLLISDNLKNNLNRSVFNNIDNVDSIYYITNNHYYDVMVELEKHNSSHIMYMVTTGAYIESFYISLNLIEEYSTENKILDNIALQKFTLHNLNKFSNTFKDNTMFSDVLRYQDELLKVFDTFSETKGPKRTFERTTNGRIVFKGGPKVKMSEAQFVKLKSTVNSLRDEIINTTVF